MKRLEIAFILCGLILVCHARNHDKNYEIPSPEDEMIIGKDRVELFSRIRRQIGYAVNPPKLKNYEDEDHQSAYHMQSGVTRKQTAYPINPVGYESEAAPESAYSLPKQSALGEYGPNLKSGATRKQTAYPINPVGYESEAAPESAYSLPKQSTAGVYAQNPINSDEIRAYGNGRLVAPPPPKPAQKQIYLAETESPQPQPPPAVQPLSNSSPEKVVSSVPTVTFKKDFSIYNLDSTSPVLESHDGDDCETALTTVQNEKVCKGQLLFYDEFDSLSPKKWSNDIRIPTKPDYEFVSYVQNKNNCYIDDSELVIKPTLLSDWSDDNIVRYGRVKLDNCLIVGDSGTCDKTADKFKILPPVLSAKVRTKQSFNFKYGRVEIRAKLPSGDWVYPEIWLEPKNNEYGPHYKSGRIVLAMSRGNDVLTGEDKHEYGCKQMNAGCLYRHDDTLKVNTYLGKVNDEGWHKGYHNYTLLWTPDALEYYLDGESIGKCQTPNSETKRHGSWRRGSKLAPFDKDFYISLGVGVGGMSEFPENITNGKENSVKPWKNGEVKAVLKFFQDQETWKKTWTENTALRVDSINVFAI